MSAIWTTITIMFASLILVGTLMSPVSSQSDTTQAPKAPGQVGIIVDDGAPI